MASHNRNPGGKNQHGDVPKADDEEFANIMKIYHREKISSNKKISERLFSDHGIKMSESSVKRRRKELALVGSGPTTRSLPHAVKEQLVLDQMNRDPAKRHGVETIQSKVAFNEEIHLTKQFVSDIMHLHDPEGFSHRDPYGKRIQRFPKHPIGIHERWSGDGHDKLYRIGFPIWAMVDDGTGKWLDAWIVPSNRMGEIIGYLFLCLVEKYGGIPLQSSTDCGSETTILYGLMNALRAIFYPEYDVDELPAHIYLRSVHNIAIERSWLRLRLDWGDNVYAFFMRGVEDGIYHSNIPKHYELCQWLWPKLLRADLANFMAFRNGVRMRKQKEKPGPSGMSRNEAFSMPEKWGGRNCLLPVDVEVVRQIKEEMGGDSLLAFVTDDYSQQAQAAYDTLGVEKLTLENVWDVFQALLPLVSD